jgi:hypothetical protein
MYSANELLLKVMEIGSLIREKTNPDGSLGFDSYPVMVSLELTKRMITREETREEKDDD